MYYDKQNGKILHGISDVKRVRKNVSFLDFGERTLNSLDIQTIKVIQPTRTAGRFEKNVQGELQFDNDGLPYIEVVIEDIELIDIKTTILRELEGFLRQRINLASQEQGFDNIISAASWVTSKKYGKQAKELVALRDTLWTAFEKTEKSINSAKTKEGILKAETAFLETLKGE